jgi:hypothetical protein
MWVAYAIWSALFKQNLRAGPLHHAACSQIARGIGNGCQHREQNHQWIAGRRKQPVNPGMLFLGGNFVWAKLIEPFLGFFFTQTGFRCAKPLKKGFDTDRRQFVDLLRNARALRRLFVVHTNRRSLRRAMLSAFLAFAFVICNAAGSCSPFEIIADNLSKSGWSWGVRCNRGFSQENDLYCRRE